jgi:hypothetical protein
MKKRASRKVTTHVRACAQFIAELRAHFPAEADQRAAMSAIADLLRRVPRVGQACAQDWLDEVARQGDAVLEALLEALPTLDLGALVAELEGPSDGR